MVAKVTFDPVNRLIIEEASAVVGGESTLDVRQEIYSEMKARWRNDENPAKYDSAIRNTGNEPLTATESAPSFFYLQNQAISGPAGGWRFRPAEIDHTINFVGNFVREDITLPLFVPTVGDFTVLITGLVFLAQQIQVSGGLTAGESAQLKDLWQFGGLDPANPATADKIAGTITAGDVLINITGDGESLTTFTRAP